MIFWDEREYLVLVRIKVCRVKTQIVVSIMKKVSYITQVDVWKADSRLATVFKDDKFCDFYITISKLNSMSPVCLNDFLIIFFLNICK